MSAAELPWTLLRHRVLKAIRDTNVFMHSRWYFHGEIRYMAAAHQLSRTANHLVNARLVDVDVDGQAILTGRGRRLLDSWSETREVV